MGWRQGYVMKTRLLDGDRAMEQRQGYGIETGLKQKIDRLLEVYNLSAYK